MKLEGYELIIAIVNKGWSDEVISAAIAAGARGATVMHGRGGGSINVPHIFGLAIEPEKEIILMAVQAAVCEKVVAAIEEVADLDQPNHGIALVLPIKSAHGISIAKHDEQQ